MQELPGSRSPAAFTGATHRQGSERERPGDLRPPLAQRNRPDSGKGRGAPCTGTPPATLPSWARVRSVSPATKTRSELRGRATARSAEGTCDPVGPGDRLDSLLLWGRSPLPEPPFQVPEPPGPPTGCNRLSQSQPLAGVRHIQALRLERGRGGYSRERPGWTLEETSETGRPGGYTEAQPELSGPGDQATLREQRGSGGAAPSCWPSPAVAPWAFRLGPRVTLPVWLLSPLASK